MKDTLMKKRFNIISLAAACVAIALICIFATMYFDNSGATPTMTDMSMDGLYDMAVRDAMTIESDEIHPLVSLTKDDTMTTWNDDGDVLLLSWHKYPDSYIPGDTVTMKYGEVWTFTDKEIAAWYKENSDGVTDWDMRLRQLIGLPPDESYTHISGFWVSPDDVLRPAYQSNAESADMTTTFSDSADENYTEWFNGNIVWSYYSSEYPWTRLGYTYDWAGGDEYGLTEFIIKKDSTAKVEFTETTAEFIARLAK